MNLKREDATGVSRCWSEDQYGNILEIGSGESFEAVVYFRRQAIVLSARLCSYTVSSSSGVNTSFQILPLTKNDHQLHQIWIHLIFRSGAFRAEDLSYKIKQLGFAQRCNYESVDWSPWGLPAYHLLRLRHWSEKLQKKGTSNVKNFWLSRTLRTSMCFSQFWIVCVTILQAYN